MTTLCFDPVGGASGDMILAALFDLGASPEAVDQALRSTGLSDFTIAFERRQDANGIVCGFCEVRTHAHHHDDDHHDHHHGRHLNEILAMIERGDFPQRAKDRAAAIFKRLAEAEGAVHDIPPEKVHFHEVGAVDSIVDIVGSCIAMECLGVDTVRCSELKIGHGTVTCAHGVLPVPAPATAKLIEGHAVRRLSVEAELTTPTGAALLTTLSAGGWNDLPLAVERIGTGHGTREHASLPNVIRAFLGQGETADEYLSLLESDIDDDTAERLAHAAERLRAAGALDVVMVPVQMKKGRPGTRLDVLTRPAQEAELARILMDETSTLGVRCQTVRRYSLARRATSVETPWGTVKAKWVERPTGAEWVPEFEDCLRLARECDVPLRQIMLAAGRTTEP